MTNNDAGAVAMFEQEGPFVDSCITDRGIAWDKLHRNGRLGFFSVFNHYLGPNNVDHMATQAKWNFEKYVMVHKEQHLIFTALRNMATTASMIASRLGISMKISRLQG